MKRKLAEDESIADSGSEVGWNSEDDQVFGAPMDDQEDSDGYYDEDSLPEGGVLLSDLFGTFDKKDPGRSSSKPAGNSKVDGFDSDSLSEMEGDESEAENHSDRDGNSRLLKAVERFSKYNRDEQKSNMKSMISESFGENFSRGLSMNALLGDLDENKGLSRVKEQLSDIGKKAAPVSVDKVVAERIERQQTYEVNKSDINKWHETVLMNRHVRTLNLANDKRELSKSRTLLNTFAPTTSLEKEISMVTFDTGITEKELEEKEMENLKGRNLSLEEIKQRQAELSKINALMFYEQMKRHRINKIKSKAYRAVQRRKRAKTEGDEVLEEKQAEERARERASLRHKNTSNWARMALEFGHTDKDLRNSYHESVRMGNELTKKMDNEVTGANDSNEDDSSNEAEDIVSSTKEQLESALQGLHDTNISKLAKGKYQKLFEMDFMKKASEKQKQIARDEAFEVLREITESVQEESAEASEVQISTLSSSKKGDPNAKKNLDKYWQATGSGFEINPHTAQNMNTFKSQTSEEPEKKTNAKSEQDDNAMDEQNPWLGKTAVRKEKRRKLQISEETVSITVPDVRANASVINSKQPRVESNSDEAPKAKPLTDLNQDDLIEMAFSGPKVEEEFVNQKQDFIDEELGINQKKLAVLKDVKAGWGDWCGPGKTQVSDKILRKRNQKLQEIETENELKRKERQDAKKANVIISERRIKGFSKYKINEIPFPFTSREEYERSLQLPLGDEWNASHVVKKITEPEIKTRAGRIIEPIKLDKKSTAKK